MRRTLCAAAVTAMVATAALAGGSTAAADDGPAAPVDPRQPAAVPPQQVGTNRLVSVRSTGESGPYISTSGELSADGRYVTFASKDGLMLPGMGSGPVDSQMYRRDLRTGALTLASRALDGGYANSYSAGGSLSADGRLLVFESNATDLVSTPVGVTPQIYLYDATTDSITLVSRARDGTAANARSVDPEISADGTRIVYSTKATNLVPGQPVSPDHLNVVSYEVTGGRHQLVSRAAGGQVTDGESREPTISGDGGRIAFTSRARNLLPVRDGDGPYDDDVFVVDVAARTLTPLRVSPQPDEGFSAQPSISADGRHLAFASTLPGLTDDPYAGITRIYLADLETRSFELVDRTVDGGLPTGEDAYSSEPSVSADGSFVTYSSYITNIVGVPTGGFHGDVYVYDVAANTNEWLSRTRTGEPPQGGPSTVPVISDDGRYIAYTSAADDLSPRDRNNALDVYVYRRS